MTDKGIFTVSKLCKRLETANITNCSFTKKMTTYLKVKRGLRWISKLVDNFVKKRAIADSRASCSTQPFGGHRIQGHQARNLFKSFVDLGHTRYAGMSPATALSPAVQMSPAFQLSHSQQKLISPQVPLVCFQIS